MPAALQARRGAARDQDRKVLVIVQAGIAHAASVQVDGVIEERAVAIGSRLHPLEELREQRHVERVDLGDLRHLFRIVAVMARGMVRVGHADLRIRAIALLARELERDDARDIRLERQNLQIEHELRVIGERGGNAHRPIQVGHRVIHRRGLGTLDLPLDLANAVEILIDANTIRDAHALLEPRDVSAERIEQAGAAAQRLAARGRVAALAEEALEDDARMRLGGERGRRRRPGEAILIDAGVAVVAHAGERVQVHRQLERRQLRLAADLPGGDLVDRRAQEIVRALGVLGEGRAQEPRVRCVVRARVGILQARVGDDGQLVFDRFERRQDGRQLRERRPGPAGSIARGRIPSG